MSLRNAKKMKFRVSNKCNLTVGINNSGVELYNSGLGIDESSGNISKSDKELGTSHVGFEVS